VVAEADVLRGAEMQLEFPGGADTKKPPDAAVLAEGVTIIHKRRARNLSR